ncbi:MAG: fatty acid desaturase, partial [Acidobacteriota bacterium]
MTTQAEYSTDVTPEPKETARLRRKLAAMARPDNRMAWTQLLGTAIPFIAGFALMIWSIDISYWLTLALAIPMVGLYIRLFIFQHDCGHGAFFPSRKANHRLGSVIGVLTLTPYYYWRRTHEAHHAGHGDLERRGLGDITTLTVREYRSLPWHKRMGYWLY